MIAFVFPGQGAQAVGMGRGLVDQLPGVPRRPSTRPTPPSASALSEIIFDGPAERLTLTEIAQPAILTVSVAACRLLEQRGVRPALVAGHSLGEYSAHVAAGTFTFADAVRTVHHRGRFMQAAVPVGEGAMAAVLGLDEAAVGAACAEAADGAGGQPGQPQRAGPGGDRRPRRRRGPRRRAGQGPRRQAGRSPLQVSAPFHCALMRPAEERLAPELRALPVRDPRVPVMANVDAEPKRDADAAIAALIRQVSAPVRWEDCVRRLTAEGATAFVEVGPGHGAERPDSEDRPRRDHREPRPAGRAGRRRGDRQRGRPAPERAFMMPFDGQVALVTGASRGIGRAIATMLAARGATVIAGARGTNAQPVADEIAAAGGRAEAAALDVTDPEACASVIADVVDRHGRLDILVCNAGITRDQLMLRMKRADWDEVIATNLTSAFSLCQAALKPMLKQRRGRIVAISSVVGQSGNAGQANYAASKAGLIGFCKSLAREVGSRQVTVNVVAPGFIETDMTRGLAEGMQAQWIVAGAARPAGLAGRRRVGGVLPRLG